MISYTWGSFLFIFCCPVALLECNWLLFLFLFWVFNSLAFLASATTVACIMHLMRNNVQYRFMYRTSFFCVHMHAMSKFTHQSSLKKIYLSSLSRLQYLNFHLMYSSKFLQKLRLYLAAYHLLVISIFKSCVVPSVSLFNQCFNYWIDNLTFPLGTCIEIRW